MFQVGEGSLRSRYWRVQGIREREEVCAFRGTLMRRCWKLCADSTVVSVTRGIGRVGPRGPNPTST